MSPGEGERESHLAVGPGKWTVRAHAKPDKTCRTLEFLPQLRGDELDPSRILWRVEVLCSAEIEIHCEYNPSVIELGRPVGGKLISFSKIPVCNGADGLFQNKESDAILIMKCKMGRRAARDFLILSGS